MTRLYVFSFPHKTQIFRLWEQNDFVARILIMLLKTFSMLIFLFRFEGQTVLFLHQGLGVLVLMRMIQFVMVHPGGSRIQECWENLKLKEIKKINRVVHIKIYLNFFLIFFHAKSPLIYDLQNKSFICPVNHDIFSYAYIFCSIHSSELLLVFWSFWPFTTFKHYSSSD